MSGLMALIEEYVRQAFDLFGNDITSQVNNDFRKADQKERRKRRAEKKRAIKKEEDAERDRKIKYLSNIVDFDEDLFGNTHTEEDKEAAKRKIDSLRAAKRKRN